MTKKIVFVGPSEVGKSTLRKWFFEGESSFKLLHNPLEPTFGFETHNYKLLEDLGVFDLAGQEIDRWLEHGSTIFERSDVIVNILNSRHAPKTISDSIERALEVQNKVAPNAVKFFLIHKIDLIDEIEQERIETQIKTLQKRLYSQVSITENIHYTSIMPEHVGNTLDVFIHIFNQSQIKEEGGIDSNLIRLNFDFFKLLVENRIMLDSDLENALNVSDFEVQDLIDNYAEGGLIKLDVRDGNSLIMLTEKGFTYYDNVLKNFQEITEKDEFEQKDYVDHLIYGLLISDKNGKTLLISSMEEGLLGKILNREGSERFDLELVPMFINALQKFSEEINVQDLSGFDVMGGNLKVSSFSQSDLTLTMFSNPKLKITPFIQKGIRTLFQEFISMFKDDLDVFNKTGNATPFLKFIDIAIEKIMVLLEDNEEKEKNTITFNIEDAKKLYAAIEQIDIMALDDATMASINESKLKLLESILKEDGVLFQETQGKLEQYLTVSS